MARDWRWLGDWAAWIPINPAIYRGGIIQLHYARAQELEPWVDRVAVRGEVVVQFWLKQVEAAAAWSQGRRKRYRHS